MAVEEDLAVGIQDSSRGDTAGNDEGGEVFHLLGADVKAGETGIVVLDVSLSLLRGIINADEDDFHLVGLHLRVLVDK